MSEFDTNAARLAASQDNVISLSDVRQLGGTKAMPYARVGREFWQRPHRGVYLHSAALPTWLQRARAGFVYCGNDAGATHRAGGYLYGLDGVDEPEVIEFTMTQNDRPSPAGVHVYRSRRPLCGGSCTADPRGDQRAASSRSAPGTLFGKADSATSFETIRLSSMASHSRSTRRSLTKWSPLSRTERPSTARERSARRTNGDSASWRQLVGDSGESGTPRRSRPRVARR